MYRKRSLNNTRNSQLTAFAGLIAGTVIATQINFVQLLRWDRMQHMTVTMMLFLIFYFFLKDSKHPWLGSAGLALVLGFSKEMTDPQIQNFDIAANILGLLLGVLLVFGFMNFSKQRNTRISH